MNMIDYIKKNGFYSFKEVPFNEVDNAILCQVSYVYFENVLKDNNKHTIKELSDLYFSKYSEKDIKKDKSLIAKSPLVLKEMAKVNRFKDIVMHHFEHSSSQMMTHQFAAMQYDLDDSTTYICFRGTDDSILGWKEDFQMAYRKIDGYNYAKSYINRHCSLNKKYRIGGHSKGGALAIYGACNCFSFKRKNIIEVYSNDGPGVRKEFIKNKLKRISDRYIKIVPEGDIIGTVFDDDYKHRVVMTNTVGFSQHNMISWQVKDSHFVKARSLSSFSKKLRKRFNDYVYNTSNKEIIKLGDTLFNYLNKIKIKKVSELFSLKANDVPRLIKEIPEVDESTKQVMYNLVMIFVKSIFPSFSFTSDKINKKKSRK